MILGKIIGKVSTNNFDFNVTSAQARKLQFIQVNHTDYDYVLCQIMELERTSDEMVAHCNVIGYKDASDGRVKGIRTPFQLGTEVLEAEDSFIKKIIELQREGAYIGKLEGKNIPINIDLQKVLTKHLSVLAKSGSGKSYFVGVLLEEIMTKNVPLLIIDPHGEYSSMRLPNDSGKDHLIEWNLEAKGFSPQIQEYGDPKVKEDIIPLKLDEKMTSYELMKMLPISLTGNQEAMLFSVVKDLEDVNFDNILIGLELLNYPGKWALIDTIMYLKSLNLFTPAPTDPNELIKPGKCTIINLRGISPEVQDIIVYKLMKDLFHARKQEKIPPFFCVLEEAHNFAPEKGFGKAKSTDIIRLISSEGRKFGLGLCIISQRPALVQKTILAQCSTQVILKVNNPNDLRALTSSIEGITSETAAEIPNLPIGSALVCGVVDRPLIVKIRPRKSKHGGEAVNILGSSNAKGEENKGVREIVDKEDYQKDVVEESQQFAKQNLLMIIKPQLS
ncbi:MAG: ATP-binding protein, partial [Nanoarchaeota archaeon]|nr:ATP-binding protein [Nanoarchaeota archaeon]